MVSCSGSRPKSASCYRSTVLYSLMFVHRSWFLYFWGCVADVWLLHYFAVLVLWVHDKYASPHCYDSYPDNGDISHAWDGGSVFRLFLLMRLWRLDMTWWGFDLKLIWGAWLVFYEHHRLYVGSSLQRLAICMVIFFLLYVTCIDGR